MTNSTRALKEQHIHSETASTSSGAQNLCQQTKEPFLDTSSIYSDYETEDNSRRSLLAASSIHSHDTRPDLNPALPYLRIVSDLRETMYPLRSNTDSSNGGMTRWKLTRSKSMPDLVAGNSLQRTQYARSDLTTKNTFRPINAATEGSFRPIMYTEPDFQSKGEPKSVRFQDIVDELATPCQALSRTGDSQPLWFQGVSKTSVRGLRRSLSALSLHLPVRVRNDGPAPSCSALTHKQTDDVPAGEPVRSAPKDETQIFHPLTDVPVKKGWVKKVVRTFAARGQQNDP